MAFIPNPNLICVGDTVQLTKSITMTLGTYTVGHIFDVVDYGPRGYDLKDSDGRRLCEVSYSMLEKVQPEEEEAGPTVNTKEILALREIFPNATTKELVDGIFAVKNAT